MAFDGLLVTEIFHSLQGETSLSGVRFAFIRLTGCNLRCSYCDSEYAFKGGKKMSIDEVLTHIRPYKLSHVLITGGEPLMQRNIGSLIDALVVEDYLVTIETHGETSIESVSKIARIVMDVKTPGSNMCRGFAKNNVPFLKAGDEVKFVITNMQDYLYACAWLKDNLLPDGVQVLFSPVVGDQVPQDFTRIIAEKILEDRLNVRFQIQLHKLLWGKDTKGV
jgi:7-carboxy-7-deazaguanine synthase